VRPDRVEVMSPAFDDDLSFAQRVEDFALAAFQKAEIEKWWPIVKEAGIRGE
jgi:hypothetical protein